MVIGVLIEDQEIVLALQEFKFIIPGIETD